MKEHVVPIATSSSISNAERLVERMTGDEREGSYMESGTENRHPLVLHRATIGNHLASIPEGICATTTTTSGTAKNAI